MVLILLLCMAALSVAVPIDNGIISIPQVQCEDEQVSMIFNTERPFTGRIFVKGLSDQDDCVMSYRGNSGTSVVFQLKAGQCNMRRQRRLGPQRGVEQSMTVIFSFHDTFITKVDRAYRCTCFFMEADKVVTADFTVSMLPTTDLFDTAKMPSCVYSVRRGSINGPIVTYARVGEELYHVWNCDSDMFGMLVHSCYVDDGTGNGKFQLLDANGCAIDPVILGDLNYNTELNMASVESHAFKFADKVTTYFQCAVSLCMKSDGACVGLTAPTCSRSRARFVRDADLIVRRVVEPKLPEGTLDAMDVAAEKIYVLEIEDDEDAPSELEREMPSHPISYYTSEQEFMGFPPSRAQPQVCLSTHGFGFMLASFLLVTIISLTVAGLCYVRNRSSLGLKV